MAMGQRVGPDVTTTPTSSPRNNKQRKGNVNSREEYAHIMTLSTKFGKDIVRNVQQKH
jgi:hypothetical protein